MNRISRHLQLSIGTSKYQQPSEDIMKASTNTKGYYAQHMESFECLGIPI